MIGLLCFALAVLASPFKSKLRLERCKYPAMLLLRPRTLQGGILLRAMVPLAQPPEANLSGRLLLLVSGQHDPIIPPANGERLAAMLTRPVQTSPAGCWRSDTSYRKPTSASRANSAMRRVRNSRSKQNSTALWLSAAASQGRSSA
jgi:hypothetical protein